MNDRLLLLFNLPELSARCSFTAGAGLHALPSLKKDENALFTAL